MGTAIKDEKQVIPPYVSFRTIVTVLDKLKVDTIPQRLDRSYWGSFMSGGVGAQVVSALRFLGLADDEDRPTARLDELVNQEDRSILMAAILRDRYEPVLRGIDLTRATMGLIDGAFKDAYKMEGETLRKSVTFFIHAAQFAKMPLSSFILKSTRKGRPPKIGKPGVRSKKTPAPRMPKGPTMPPTNGTGTNTKTISLRSGGSVAITFTFDLFAVDEEDRQFCFDLIDTLRKYEQEVPVAFVPGDTGPGDEAPN
jgi:Family of unknown function (DUF5343)